MSKTVDKIRKLAKEAADKKVAEENDRIQQGIRSDLVTLEKILSMVKDHLVYKEVKPSYGRTTYVVVTEEIVLEDYANKPKYGSGTRIERTDGSYYSYPHTVITVNGHKYYHAADLLTRYKFDARKAMEKAEQEYEAARHRKEAIDDLEGLEPLIKELMLNYDKHLGANKVQ